MNDWDRIKREAEKRKREEKIIEQQKKIINLEREKARQEAERRLNEQIKQLEIDDEKFVKSSQSVKVSFTKAISLDPGWFFYPLALAIAEIEGWQSFINNCISELQKEWKSEKFDNVSSIITDLKKEILAVQNIISQVKNEIGDLGNLKTKFTLKDEIKDVSLEDLKVEDRLNAEMLKISEAEKLLIKITRKKKNIKLAKISCGCIMIFVIIIFIIIAISSIGTNYSDEKTSAPPSQEWTCAARACNIRSGPGKEHSFISTINQGDKVKCVLFKNDWCKIKADADQWIHKSILSAPN